MFQSILRRGLYLLMALAFFILPLYLRSIFDAKSYLDLGRTLRAQKNYPEAVQAFRKCVSWNSPFNRYAVSCARDFYNMADLELEPGSLKLDAFRELRSGILNSRSMLSFNPEVAKILNESDAKIAELSQDQVPGVKIIQEVKLDPNYKFQILSHFMFWGWIVSVVYLIFAAFSHEGKLLGKKFASHIIPVVIFYGLWLWALRLA